MNPSPAGTAHRGHRRRWFLALEPIFEAGRTGKKAKRWDVEDELIAVAGLGDVTIDLSQARSVPAEVNVQAYAILRDVTVLVPDGAAVKLEGGSLWGDLVNEAPPAPPDQRTLLIHVHGHTLAGDVTIRSATT